MCIVIDMNVIGRVFDSNKNDSYKYQPVLNWILHQDGMLVVGGSTFFEELRKLTKYLKFYNILNKAGKVKRINDEDVDAKMEELITLCDHRDFDDPHIVALLIVSGCKVLCTEDKRSIPFVKNKAWYEKNQKVPSIYNSSSYRNHRNILSTKNLTECCMPSKRLNKSDVGKLGIINV
jgi:predicted nucleic acid-binding protein